MVQQRGHGRVCGAHVDSGLCWSGTSPWQTIGTAPPYRAGSPRILGHDRGYRNPAIKQRSLWVGRVIRYPVTFEQLSGYNRSVSPDGPSKFIGWLSVLIPELSEKLAETHNESDTTITRNVPYSSRLQCCLWLANNNRARHQITSDRQSALAVPDHQTDTGSIFYNTWQEKLSGHTHN